MQRDFDFLGEFSTVQRHISLGGSRSQGLTRAELLRKREEEKRFREQQRRQEKAASKIQVSILI